MGTEEQKINPVARNILQFYFQNAIINQYWRETVVMGLILWSAITTERFSLLTLTEIVGAVSIIVFRLVSLYRSYKSQKQHPLALTMPSAGLTHETIVLDPDDEASVEQFTRALAENNRHAIPPAFRDAYSRRLTLRPGELHGA